MKTLSRSLYDKAVHFLNHDARPLERALYAYHFAGSPASDVLNAVATFQNADGGFGHALEPDMRLNDSSVIATTVAFQHFRELNLSADNPILANACRYLLNIYDSSHVNWPIIPPNVDDAPHAPWWVHSGDLENSKSNPRAEIAGYLNEYPQHFPDEMRETVTRSVVDYLLDQPDQLEMHDLMCYIRLSETPNLSDNTRQTLLEKLKCVVANTVEHDPEKWKNYGLPPLSVIASPDSPFADLFTDSIHQNLDFIIDRQNEDGTWKPNWSWGDQWPDAWEQTKHDWMGVITLDNLRKLRAFGRLPG
jgi:hypothetical protein